jgi:hypothetical protein
MRYGFGKASGRLLAILLLGTACESADVLSTNLPGAVLTIVDDGPALAAARTFALPDTLITLPTNSTSIGHESSVAIVGRVRAHLLRLGWIDVTSATNARPDVVVLVVANERLQTGWAYADWFGAWGYLPYWGPAVDPTSVWGVPGGAIPYSFVAGTVLVTMLDLRNQRGSVDDIALLWAAGVDGVVTGPTSTLDRALLGLDQAFVQSPYLRRVP